MTVELSISSLFPTIPSSRASSLQYASFPPWSFSPCSYTSFGCVVVYILNNLPPPSSLPLQVAGFHRIVQFILQGHVGSTNWGINFLVEEGIIPEIVRLAVDCGNFAIRGYVYLRIITVIGCFWKGYTQQLYPLDDQ